jgi:hypoxanthine phosphoribosyltransferase
VDDDPAVNGAPGGHAAMGLTWPQIENLVSQITSHASRDGAPQAIVAVLRGGAVPATMLSHRLGVRDVRAVTVMHTADDSVNAAKTPAPTAVNPASLGDLTGRDVLVVDDVAGTGQAIAAAARIVGQAGAAKVRTAVCVLNEDNWTDPGPAHDAITYIGATVRGWAVFPWEKSDDER